jgi:hypothetical protein
MSRRRSFDSKSVADFLSLLFASATQSHILHLQTKSYAAHKALQGYYEGIVPLIDTYAETYQGKYGIIQGYSYSELVEGDKQILPYFKELEELVTVLEQDLPKDVDLQNTYADILDLIHKTNYLLRYLH